MFRTRKDPTRIKFSDSNKTKALHNPPNPPTPLPLGEKGGWGGNSPVRDKNENNEILDKKESAPETNKNVSVRATEDLKTYFKNKSTEKSSCLNNEQLNCSINKQKLLNIIASETSTEADFKMLKSILKDSVGKFTEPQKKELTDILLLSVKTSKATKVDDRREFEIWSDAVLLEISKSIGSTVSNINSVPFLKDLARASFVQFNNFMIMNKIDNIMTSERRAFSKLVAELLVKHSKTLSEHVQAPLSAKFVFQQSSKIPGIFEDAFPGYAKSGLMHVVVKQFTKKV